MGFVIETTIDGENCIGCGECLRVCPTDAFTLDGDKAVVSGDESIGCGHCAAVCPTGAIEVAFEDEAATEFATFEGGNELIGAGSTAIGPLVSLMRSRRSCRNFIDRPVDLPTLEDLVRIGTTAPSGTNSQAWTFTILPDREAVLNLATGVAGFYARLNRRAANPVLRWAARIFAGDALGRYHRAYFERIEEGLRQWREEGRERLFHGAPAALLVGGLSEASCPGEDALLATQNILLASHAMGLGTCLIGFVVEAVKRDRVLQAQLHLEPGERIYSVIALGWPDERWTRPAGRRLVKPRVLSD